MKTSICLVALCAVILLGGCARKPRLSKQEAIATARPFVSAWRGKDTEIRQSMRLALFEPKERIWSVGFYSGMVHDDTFVRIQDTTGKAQLFSNDCHAIEVPEDRNLDDPRSFLSLEDFRKAIAHQRSRHR